MSLVFFFCLSFSDRPVCILLLLMVLLSPQPVMSRPCVSWTNHPQMAIFDAYLMLLDGLASNILHFYPLGQFFPNLLECNGGTPYPNISHGLSYFFDMFILCVCSVLHTPYISYCWIKNLVGGLEHFLFFHILGISQLTNIIFQRGRYTTNQKQSSN